MGDYKNLEVWKKSRALTAEVYRVTERFPRSEMFGITSQMRRAALSIGLNVAEGNGRWTTRDQGSFIVTARASAQELEAVLCVSEDLRLITPETSDHLREKTNEIGRMLNGLLKYYRKT
jgi:four helix bundle protein